MCYICNSAESICSRSVIKLAWSNSTHRALMRWDDPSAVEYKMVGCIRKPPRVNFPQTLPNCLPCPWSPWHVPDWHNGTHITCQVWCSFPSHCPACSQDKEEDPRVTTWTLAHSLLHYHEPPLPKFTAYTGNSESGRIYKENTWYCFDMWVTTRVQGLVFSIKQYQLLLKLHSLPEIHQLYTITHVPFNTLILLKRETECLFALTSSPQIGPLRNGIPNTWIVFGNTIYIGVTKADSRGIRCRV